MAAPMTPLHGTLVCRGTPVGNHCSRVLSITLNKMRFNVERKWLDDDYKVTLKLLKWLVFLRQLRYYKNIYIFKSTSAFLNNWYTWYLLLVFIYKDGHVTWQKLYIVKWILNGKQEKERQRPFISENSINR